MQTTLTFDRTKPFYPLILSFYATLYGSLALTDIQDGKTSIDESLSIKASEDSDVTFDWPFIEAEFKKLNISLSILLETPLRMLLISAYEVSVQHYDPNDSVWRFFKHARNAAAHDGFFYLIVRNGISPISGSKPATWKSKEIQMFMNGTPLLIDDGDTEAFLKPGDVLHLLKDVENKFS
jgi:hypothetical protein